MSLDHFLADENLLTGSAKLHVKVDVDGIEHKVVSSAENALKSGQVQSMLIELNTNLDEHNHIIEQMSDFGYSLMVDDRAIRDDGHFKGIGNHIFTLKD